MDHYPEKRIYSLEEEKSNFQGDYRQRERELLTRLKGKKTPFGQDRVGVLREHQLTWSDLDMIWKKEIAIKLDIPKKRGKVPKPIDEKNQEFKIIATGSNEERCLGKAWLDITNAFHSRMNPKAPQPKAPPSSAVSQ